MCCWVSGVCVARAKHTARLALYISVTVGLEGRVYASAVNWERRRFVLVRAGLSLVAALFGVVGTAGPLWPGAADGHAAASYRIAIPGLGADSAAPALPIEPGSPSPLVTIRNSSTSAIGGLTIYGEVYNGLEHAITNVRVTANASGGSQLATKTVAAITTEIGAKQSGLFQVSFFGTAPAGAAVDLAVASYEELAVPVQSAGLAVTLSGPSPLLLISYDPITHAQIIRNSPTNSILEGIVTNHGTRALTAIDITAALYDPAGRVVLTGRASSLSVTFQGAVSPVLQPGQSGTFTVPLLNSDYANIQGSVTLKGFANAKAAP